MEGRDTESESKRAMEVKVTRWAAARWNEKKNRPAISIRSAYTLCSRVAYMVYIHIKYSMYTICNVCKRMNICTIRMVGWFVSAREQNRSIFCNTHVPRLLLPHGFFFVRFNVCVYVCVCLILSVEFMSLILCPLSLSILSHSPLHVLNVFVCVCSISMSIVFYCSIRNWIFPPIYASIARYNSTHISYDPLGIHAHTPVCPMPPPNRTHALIETFSMVELHSENSWPVQLSHLLIRR